MIVEIQSRGKLIHECSLDGETRADGFCPGHINAAQVSRNRFLLLYTTRGWRGTDDNTSVIFQLRDGAYDGPLIREGRLALSIDDWDPLGDGRKYTRAHVHPLVFGVPKDARIGGKVPDHAGVFVFLWNRHGRYIDPETGFMPHVHESGAALTDGAAVTEWAQLRLNDAEDDLEAIQPVRVLRQKGYNGYPFCEAEVRRMVLTFTPPVPYNDEASEWIGSSGFVGTPGTRVASMRFTFNRETGTYEWTRMGSLSAKGMYESSVARFGDAWIISSRLRSSTQKVFGGPVAWFRADDPFDSLSDPILPTEPRSRAPSTVFACPDGVIRLLTNDRNLSPYKHHRNPLYMWNIDPDEGFSASNRVSIFDSVEKGFPIREVSRPVVDQAKLLPHVGGNMQILAHRVRPVSINNPDKTGVPINEEEKEICGIYYAAIRYDRSYPGLWRF